MRERSAVPRRHLTPHHRIEQHLNRYETAVRFIGTEGTGNTKTTGGRYIYRSGVFFSCGYEEYLRVKSAKHYEKRYLSAARKYPG